MLDIAIDPRRRLYVIASSDGVRCLGFDKARDHARRIADCLMRPDLQPTPEEEGTPAGYRKYLSAIQAWLDSPRAEETYFGPGCSKELASALEACRHSRSKVHLVVGDTGTGSVAFDDNDVVGRIGRSHGALKVPLLLEDGQAFGSPVTCGRVLAILDWETGLALYRHPGYRPPELKLAFCEHESRPWSVMHRDSTIARFADIGKAGAYIAFMRGASVEPRFFR
ncbi:hypothetical protein [Aquabacterium humicola]|uniref:hypothetical protein n=1 Tax=Aquabacterium humicola TaxID=3237377 RepID=UPI002543A382|nr:hypothetical protein [Rubrivivax pictus]